MNIIVMKFGGTSVGSTERIQEVAKRVEEKVKAGYKCVVVLSAMGKTTDHLVNLVKELNHQPSPRELDMLLTTGEQISIALLSVALHKLDLEARSFTGWQAGIVTDEVHGKAAVHQVKTEKLFDSLEKGEVAVVAGFQGVTDAGEITTLGRGGSDTTAVTLAAALDAEYCEIYTDVTGVYTADPRFIDQAQKIDEISYEEMLELARLGAGVLHPRSVECALTHKVKLVVRSSFEREPGTWIKEKDEMEETLQVRGIAHDMDVARVKLLGLPNQSDILAKLFTTLADAHINVDIIVQSEHQSDQISVAFSISEAEGQAVQKVLREKQSVLGFQEMLFEGGLAKVSAVGVGMMTRPGVAANMFACLSEANIPVKMVSTSEIKLSCVIDRDKAIEAANSLHRYFGLGADSKVSI
ncbi:aspartate kinase [Shimazuella alba]|uniref:Aspartokinase n=1 Tax=Shimazuella alba TaxID=2690964 RepID=A0A6I4VX78_9BACL|nr:aspartate kinase [Shimazuella alba]MXQ55463.1 aspartate kinase [Shimazuella alba]